MISRYDQERMHALADLKLTLEGKPVNSPEFVYVTYIHTTPEKLWQALTDPAFTCRYWGSALESDWKVESPVLTLAAPGAETATWARWFSNLNCTGDCLIAGTTISASTLRCSDGPMKCSPS